MATKYWRKVFKKVILCSFMIPLISCASFNGVTTNNTKPSDAENSLTPAPEDTIAIAIYVSPDGNDANPGTIAAPVLTLEKARDLVKTVNDGQRDVVVYLRKGVYSRSASFALGNEDSGKNGHTITYRAYKNENAVITGSVQIPASRLESVTDKNALAKIDPDIVMHVKQIDLKALGFIEIPRSLMGEMGKLSWLSDESNAPELFYNDAPMTVARWPNGNDYAMTGSITDAGANPRYWMDDTINEESYVPEDQRDTEHGFTMKYSDPRIDKWAGETNAYMYGFWYYDWFDQVVQIKEVDTQEKTVTSIQPSLYTAREGVKFYAFNILSELDMPGEYYVDADNGLMFFYQPPDTAPRSLAYTTLTDPIVKMDSASNIRFMHMTFEFTRGDTISQTGESDNNLFYDLTIRNTAGNGITITGKNNGVEYCRIYNVNGGVDIQSGDRQTLEPGSSYVENCDIHDFARIKKTYTNAITLGGVGNRASNNELSNAIHQALGFSGNDHLIEYNDIHDVVLDSDDAGAIYAGRNITMRGTVIKNNYIHHLGHFSDHPLAGDKPGSTGTIAIYLDDGFGGTDIHNNVLYKTDRGLMLNGGAYTSFRGNVIMGASVPVFISDAMLDQSGDGTWDNNGYGLYVPGTRDPAVPFKGSAYAKYEGMNDIELNEPRRPKGNDISGNVADSNTFMYLYTGGMNSDDYRTLNNIEDHAVIFIKESDFKDVGNNDFTITNQEILSMPDFLEYTFSKTGIQGAPVNQDVVTAEINANGTVIP